MGIVFGGNFVVHRNCRSSHPCSMRPQVQPPGQPHYARQPALPRCRLDQDADGPNTVRAFWTIAVLRRHQVPGGTATGRAGNAEEKVRCRA